MGRGGGSSAGGSDYGRRCWAWLWVALEVECGGGGRGYGQGPVEEAGPPRCMRYNGWHLINVSNTVPISLPDFKLVKVIFIQLV